MRNFLLKRQILFFLSLMLVLVACATVPITGRHQLTLIPAAQINAMSFQNYQQVLAESHVITDTPEAQMVKSVGQRIQGAVERYFAEHGMSDQLSGYAWEFNLIEDDQVNAWCMPGGKVAVYTGILPITQTEEGLAVVMGHEIAHAIANHGNERMSQGLLQQFGGLALAEYLKDKPETTQALFLGAYGIGTTVGLMLPFSRKQEAEADHLGLIFMAMAGYNPEVAVDFWARMADTKGGAAPPEFLSTHPSDQTRINHLRQLIPEAMEYYQPR
ncbi:MAG: M48 family peptidase [Gemmatimonadetes bacterium]|nr:MAG: M48 family peptidase [Gemmatimonadota bacterium]